MPGLRRLLHFGPVEENAGGAGDSAQGHRVHFRTGLRQPSASLRQHLRFSWFLWSAPALATGLRLANPQSQIWVVTGDGDALSAGANHLIHAMRRNVDLKIVLFNNEVLGLTKGQCSPTSRAGTRTKSTPAGSFETTLRPISLALAAEATFVARTIDVDVKST